jgi:glycosyltransferase involved in cell wall biosynthesis
VKIALFANTDWYLAHYRLSLAQALYKRGDEVFFISPAGKYHATLEQAGFRWVEFPLDSKGVNPFVEIATVGRLMQLYRREQPDLIHNFTVKCVLYGSLAARLVGIKRIVNSITGLGYVFTEQGFGAKTMRLIVNTFYRIALPGSRVIFQNPDDRDIFLREDIVKEADAVVIRGSGVDLTTFTASREPDGVPIVILPSRMLWHKGVKEFVDAARLLKEEGVEARFVLVGDSDPLNPASIPNDQLKVWDESGVIEWWGWRDDMQSIFSQTHIVCLPSYYREGVPRALVEALASGRPIVTTDAPGCREVVVDGENGLLVQPRDSIRLAKALRSLIEDPALRQKMGWRSREIAEKDFSVEMVIAKTLGVYQALSPV